MRESAAAAHATTNTAAAATTTSMTTASAASPKTKTSSSRTGTRLIGGKDFRRHAQPQGGGLFFYMSKECM